MVFDSVSNSLYIKDGFIYLVWCTLSSLLIIMKHTYETDSSQPLTHNQYNGHIPKNMYGLLVAYLLACEFPSSLAWVDSTLLLVRNDGVVLASI